MEAGSSRFWLNSRKYNGKNANETYWLNQYPMANHGNYKIPTLSVTLNPSLGLVTKVRACKGVGKEWSLKV